MLKSGGIPLLREREHRGLRVGSNRGPDAGQRLVDVERALHSLTAGARAGRHLSPPPPVNPTTLESYDKQQMVVKGTSRWRRFRRGAESATSAPAMAGADCRRRDALHGCELSRLASGQTSHHRGPSLMLPGMPLCPPTPAGRYWDARSPESESPVSLSKFLPPRKRRLAPAGETGWVAPN